MDFRQLEYFTEIVKAGSVSQAAKTLNMTQPPLSAAIARLERETGVQLLMRSAHGVQPTNAGRYLLQHAGQLLASRSTIERVLNLMGRGLVGELRVGAEPMGIQEILAEVLAEFATAAPDARVALADVGPRSILDGVGSGQYDIGCLPFAPEAIARSIAERFEWIPLTRIDIKLAVPLSRVRERHVGGRGWGRWILPHPLPGLPGMVDAVEAELAGEANFDSILVSTPQTAIPLVAAGLGVAPTTSRIWAQRPGVSIVAAPEWLKPMQVTLVHRKGIEISPLMARWIEIARSVAASHKP